MLKISSGDTDALRWFVDWTVHAWASGLGMAGIKTFHEVAIKSTYLRTQDEEDKGKEDLLLEVRTHIPYDTLSDAVSKHQWVLPLYEVWQEGEDSLLVASKVLVAMLSQMSKVIIQRMEQVEDAQRNGKIVLPDLDIVKREDMN